MSKHATTEFAELRHFLLLSSLLLLTACADKISLIRTDIEPVITDNQLMVTLANDKIVNLDFKGDEELPTTKTECPKEVYLDIGSYTYVEKVLSEEVFSNADARVARERELRETIDDRQNELENLFYSETEDIKSINLRCNLVLQPEDKIHVKFRFIGPKSSNVEVACLGDGQQRAQIRNPASTEYLKSQGDKVIHMLTFQPSNCGIKPLVDGGGQYVDEYGGVRSFCDPVKNIKIKNCRIRGHISARSLRDPYHDLSVVRADHVERLQASAAQHVTFSNVQILGRLKGAVHLLPGVHHFTIEDSEILGGFHSMTIHLPADGGWNVIKNNRITGQRKRGILFGGKEREVISIDSSEHNRIVNNHISDMPYGAIRLYRNCGESGAVRHRIPQYNQIINNVFDYSEGDQDKPTIILGSRDDLDTLGGVKRYCGDDRASDGSAYPSNDDRTYWDTAEVFSSSEDNDDWAQNNVIAENQWIQFIPTDSLKPIKRSDKNKALVNYLISNETDSDRSAETALRIMQERGAGCAVLAGITHGMQPPYLDPISNGHLPYILNGEVVKYFWNIEPPVRLSCGQALVCQNNILSREPMTECLAPIIEDFGQDGVACDAPNNVCDDGEVGSDAHLLGCTEGRLIGVQAACNLEFGRVTDAKRDQALLNRVTVVRASDNVDEGSCQVDGTAIAQGNQLITPWLLNAYNDVGTANQLNYQCSERDRRGGECHINIRQYCEPE
ncbi:right-handed parallel beta-helix repeat-containing protein [Marinicella sp. S1101]|uniref:right-handed parallel beta-helix repeat-containing protein n=1 Tax=Marinicella marina TaxID=2996016 RepID=UPI002260F18D|nr:right-handed parallel beta-helix repeat-containing protein [Marinicella marina]MCX7554390.1 right-handed parallel beta-helix repeat-containing protein [Marinicella marina]MDJ1138619.1 right-handed parallel beta-helix repeat-containing protein [Marinicella marina]